MRHQEQEIVRVRLRERMDSLPNYAVDFLYILETSKEVQTLFEYAKDWDLFFRYLTEHKYVKAENTADITLEELNQLTPRQVTRFFDYISSYKHTYQTSSGNSKTQVYTNGPQGKSRKLASLNKLFTHLAETGKLSANPTHHVEIKLPTKAHIGKRLTRDEVERFFSSVVDGGNMNSREELFHDKLKLRDYAISLLFAYTGIRISELRDLNIDELFFEEEHFVVTRKGGNQQVIYMPGIIIKDLKAYLEHRLSLTKKFPNEQALFLSLRGTRMDQRTIRNMIEKHRVRSNITKKITPHTFRRTFGTKHYNDYEDMYLTAQVLGHSSAETTRRYYANPDEKRVSKSMQKFKY